MTGTLKSAARSAETKPLLRVLARGGYFASGLVHLLVGALAILVAWRGRGESDQAGALAAVESIPLGFFVLWGLAALLWALGVYHAIHGVAVRVDGRGKRWMRRLSEWGQAVVFIAMGSISAGVALGARPDADRSAADASRGLLTVPGGPLLLALAGIAVGAGGAAFVVMGLRRSYRQRIDLPAGAAGHAISALGVVGFVAKGVALLVIGALAVIAATRHDPEAVGALDSAIRALRELPFGALIVGLVGAGFIAYGIFCGFRGRYARL